MPNVHVFRATFKELTRQDLQLQEPLTKAEAVLYEDTDRPGVHITVVKGSTTVVQVGRPEMTVTGELFTEHTPEAPHQDPDNHARILTWMVKRIALDLMKEVTGATWIERTPTTH